MSLSNLEERTLYKTLKKECKNKINKCVSVNEIFEVNDNFGRVCIRLYIDDTFSSNKKLNKLEDYINKIVEKRIEKVDPEYFNDVYLYQERIYIDEYIQ
jgi:hypothetical protein